MRPERLHLAIREFPYPGHNIPGLCDVDIYALPTGEALVLLRDQWNHNGPSVINAIETVARLVRDAFLVPFGVQGPVVWMEWTRSSSLYGGWATVGVVQWADPSELKRPEWQIPSQVELVQILERFGAIEDFRRWITEGTILPSNFPQDMR
ncbi:hypothetical protein [Thermus caldifontis]|uniref:hypothetical protein n=1 Tax=Thermus caldifontis TaxID=1930763 RepID=UPI000DF195E7|nr:hypothetical protein [Thermus caldifontis]